MKVTTNKEDKEIKYPCLMELDGHVVLFGQSGCGMKLVFGAGNGITVGDYDDGFDMYGYKPFKGTITLEND